MSLVAHDEAQSLKERIFAAAITVFAEYGLPGARMEQIAIEAQTTKRMVVYYFKSKEQLYQAVLQHVYAQIRETEQQLGLEHLPPVEALAQLVKWSVRYHATHADYMRVICMENMQRGKWLKGSEELKPLNRTALSIIEDILQRGQQQGIFQAGLQARDVHRLISSFSFYQVSNFYTFSSLYLDDPLPEIDDEAMVSHHCEIAVKAVIRFVIS
ncbi:MULTISPECIES: TetR family transcriptional regulator [Klebsiella]|jgi:transcriptional regulator, TetR family|uniref:TetR family transcriptional regulator n=1 Tax=Klebsiella TaxID=570 RepID=UPI0005EFA378|nr:MULTISPECIES: TetR family transcriptional regulator [Klebsiella]EIW9477979.1 TetR family transcriptional regulator [Klebsiella aerogenes]EIW9498183.1 TetR family transcriptional regulator [Klebsiella aerogenes]EKM7511479.1 TetR family transcriptional regulator [Klebsiella aerogenes]EKU6608078.1 TetR family transcriptional regulator [Klebsiella aerogenes]EKU8182043.1 TetR family transcriptional regulator [Klebsiella aerogenes]